MMIDKLTKHMIFPLICGLMAVGSLSQLLHAQGAPSPAGAEDRAYWLGMMDKVSRPVLEAAAAKELKKRMPLEKTKANAPHNRDSVAHLEAVGRLMMGIAPWLELDLANKNSDEARLQAKFRVHAVAAIDAITEPRSPDYCNYAKGHQPLVDAAFLAQALLRAPRQLWEPLSATARANVIRAFKDTMRVRPAGGNWMMFSATLEAALEKFAGDGAWFPEMVEFALCEQNNNYQGDGAYGDGPMFRWDYYNAFVIQPMILDVLDTLGKRGPWVNVDFEKNAKARARRYAAVQERLISPEGAFPPVGRSLAYRVGALQVLAQISLRGELPKDLPPAQARCALTAALKRSMEAPGTFDDGGWLRVGFCGAQPSVGEGYISTGSLYLCSAVFLPLGLPADNVFWSGPATDWTAKKFYSGQDVPNDHAMSDPGLPRRRAFVPEVPRK